MTTVEKEYPVEIVLGERRLLTILKCFLEMNPRCKYFMVKKCILRTERLLEGENCSKKVISGLSREVNMSQGKTYPVTLFIVHDQTRVTGLFTGRYSLGKTEKLPKTTERKENNFILF